MASKPKDNLPGKGAWTLGKETLAVDTALCPLSRRHDTVENTPSTKHGASKKDSKKANIFQLMANSLLRNLGGVSRSPDSWLGLGKVVNLHETKGLMGMAAM